MGKLLASTTCRPAKDGTVSLTAFLGSEKSKLAGFSPLGALPVTTCFAHDIIIEKHL